MVGAAMQQAARGIGGGDGAIVAQHGEGEQQLFQRIGPGAAARQQLGGARVEHDEIGLGACGQGSSPPPSSAPAAAPRAAAAAPAPATTWTKRFFIGRWAAREDMCGQPWIITDGGLSTPGEVSCRFRGLSDTPAGAEADARCTAEGPPRPYRLTFSYAQSARALLIEGGPFRDAGLVRCGDAPPPVEPRPPGTPGGLPDDRTPVSEAPFSATSAQGAANVVQVYFASVSDGDFGKAWRQLRPEARATFGGEAAFRKRFSSSKTLCWHRMSAAARTRHGAPWPIWFWPIWMRISRASHCRHPSPDPHSSLEGAASSAASSIMFAVVISAIIVQAGAQGCAEQSRGRAG